MIEHLQVVAHGRPATQALAGAIQQARDAAGPLAPVTVVVPSNFAGLAARRLLGAGVVGTGGVANVSFLTPFRLAELLSADQLPDRRPLTNPVLGSAVRRCLARDPGPFAPVAEHLATERALAALYAELSSVSEDALDSLHAAGGLAAAAVAQYRAIEERLAGFHGEDDVAVAARQRPDLHRALAPFGGLVWYLPEPATPALSRFLAAVLAAAPCTVILGVTGHAAADDPVFEACRRVGVEVPPGTSAQVDVPVGSHIVSVTDPDEEVRAVVRRIMALAEQGVPLHRIGVFHPVADPYLRTLRQQLEQAGIPANGPSQERLADTVVGRTLLAALALPARRWRRDRVMALVSGAPVRHGGRRVNPGSWEVLSRRAGVVGDVGDWDRKLGALADELSSKATTTEGHEAARAARQRDEVQALLRFVADTAAAVSAVDSARSWTAKVVAARRLVDALLGSASARSGWPDDEQEASERIDDALSRLAALDDLEPNPTPEVFRRALAAELDVRRGRHGRFGHGVVYGPLSGAVGQDLDAVFIVGMAEGSCPAPRRDEALLPDSVRLLAGPGQLPLRAAALEDQHRWFLAALAAAPPERRWLLYPRGDLRGGRSRLPSRWLLDTASARAGRAVYSSDFAGLDAAVVEVVPSFAAGLLQMASPASPDERDLASVAAHVAAGGVAGQHPASAPVRRGLEALQARRSSRFTIWDGNLASSDVPSPTDEGQVVSPTRLERWAACGFRYLLADVLGLADRDEPERLVELRAVDRGSLVHEVLERFFGEVIAHGAPDPQRRWSDEDRQRLQGLADEVFDRYESAGLTGRPVRWRLQQTQIRALLDDFLTADDEHRARMGARPIRVELPFGFDGVDPVVVELANGRQLRFRGRADRVDVGAGNRHVVLDYKTSKGDRYGALDEDPVLGGTTLQLGVYAEAARQVLGADTASGYYWMVNDSSCSDRCGYDWSDDRRERFVEVLGTIVDGIGAGVFAAQPGGWDSFRRTHENCAYCPFDSVCPVDRGEQAAAKAGADELRIRHSLRPCDEGAK